MTFSITTLLTFIGSLGLFLYGMKLMSEALQKVAGSKMRSISSGAGYLTQLRKGVTYNG